MNNLKFSWRGFLYYIQEFPSIMAITMLYYTLKSAFPFVGIYYSARIVDALVHQQPPNAIWHYVYLTLGISALLMLISYFLKRWLDVKLFALHNINTHVFTRKFLSLDYALLDDTAIHNLHAYIAQNACWEQFGFVYIYNEIRQIIQSVSSIVIALFMSYSLFISHTTENNYAWLNAWYIPVLIVIFIILINITAGYFTRTAESKKTELSKGITFTNQLISHVIGIVFDYKRNMDIRLNHQQPIAENIINKNDFVNRHGPMEQFYKGVYGQLIAAKSVLIHSILLPIYCYVAFKALGGAFGIGSVAQYIGSMMLFSTALGELIQSIAKLSVNEKFMAKAFELIDTPNTMYQGSLTTEKRDDYKYDIEFKNVSFKYPGSNTYVLKNLNYKFQIGNRLAIVGPNGSGKSTFIKLLCRLYDPTEGEILLNGIDIKKYDYHQYMAIFATVFQDFELLSFTIKDNITSGRPADDKLIHQLLNEVNFNLDNDKFKQGIDTYIEKSFDDDGVNLSGGERQKIALARALYQNASFIILDEPTAALDPITEEDIYKRFDSIVNAKTSIYISHRLSSTRFCDEIAVFDDGQIVEHGKHNQLIEQKDSLYSKLWQAQASYYV